MDPLKIKAELINSTGKDLDLLKIWNNDELFVFSGEYYSHFQIKKAGEDKWIKVLQPAFVIPEGNPTVFIGSRDTLQSEFYILPVGVIERRYRPLAPGKYQLRMVYQASPRSYALMASNELNLELKPYQGSDAEAYEWLSQLEVPHFIYEAAFSGFDRWGVISIPSRGKTKLHAEQLLEKYPRSKFAPWAKLHLAYCYRFGIYPSSKLFKNKDLEKAEIFARQANDSSSGVLRLRVDEFLKRYKDGTRNY